MLIIIISGPSGSGKTTFSKEILKKLKNGIILNTDNYYRTGIISRFLSIIITSYFDRNISFNFKLFREDLVNILKSGNSKYLYNYDFKCKSIKKIYKKTNNIKFVIIEGIFGREILNTLFREKCLLIILKTKKHTCMKRVIRRDFIERGKSKSRARYDFLKAWEIFHNKNKDRNTINYLKKIIIENKTDLKVLIKEIINLEK